MKSLLFLIRKRLKNMILAMIKNPGQLIFILFLLAMFILNVVSGNIGDSDQNEATGDIRLLYAIVFAFYGMMFFFSIRSGFKSGATFFSLADVNLTFCTPIHPKTILLYGMVRQLGMSLFGGFFFAFQYGWMHRAFGVTAVTLAGLLVGYALTLFCGQMLAMLIYSYTARDERRQKFAERIALVIIAVLVAWILYPVLSETVLNHAGKLDITRLIPSLVESVNRPIMQFVPLIGWMKALVQGVHEGNLLLVLASFGATAAFSLLFVWVIGKMDIDYYEDVLFATEVMHSAVSAKKEGRVTEVVPKNVKVGAQGIRQGKGASVFFYKHLLENRRMRKFIMDTTSLIFALCTLVFAYFMRDTGSIPALTMSVYMLIFSSFMGKWIKELLYPYVYLIPQPAFKKLLMILGETILKNLIESVIIGVGIGLIIQVGAIETVAIVAVRFGVSLLFIAGTILSERLFGGLTIRWMQITFLTLTLIFCLVPMIVTIVLLTSVGGTLFAGYFAATAIAAGMFLLILFLCRNILNNAELNNR